MLSKQSMEGRYQVSMIALNQVVPENILVRKIEKAMDFNFIYDLMEDKYSMDNGRPSIDPCCLNKDGVHSVFIWNSIYAINNPRDRNQYGVPLVFRF